MKKVVSLVCFVVVLAMADNTIDLSNAPLSHQVQKVKSSSTGEFGIGYLISLVCLNILLSVMKIQINGN